MSGFTNVTIDDADPQVEYPPFQPWRQIQTSNPKVKNGTLTELSVPGFLQFSFTGTELWVYGTVMPTVQAKDKARIVAQFALGGPSGVADTITTFTSPALSQEGDGVLFWASGPLDLGYYQLLVNVTSASTDSPFAIDYLVYTKQQPLSSQPEDPFSVTESPPATSPVSVALSLTPLPSSASSTPSSTSILSSEPSVGSMSSPNSTPQTVDSSPNTSTSHSRHVGAIVGGVLGGVAFLAVVLICFLYWRRLRSRQSNLGSQVTPTRQWHDDRGDTGVSTPYLLPPDYSTVSAGLVPQEAAGPMTAGMSGILVHESTGKARFAGSEGL